MVQQQPGRKLRSLQMPRVPSLSPVAATAITATAHPATLLAIASTIAGAIGATCAVHIGDAIRLRL